MGQDEKCYFNRNAILREKHLRRGTGKDNE